MTSGLPCLTTGNQVRIGDLIRSGNDIRNALCAVLPSLIGNHVVEGAVETDGCDSVQTVRENRGGKVQEGVEMVEAEGSGGVEKVDCVTVPK